ncbi:hypothetical protein [Amycolatopsis taiwanensis]|uniref:Uncharacterized protein n=1 Tax=Amycolatopsis taiwanensis TaxID=342230 RepID=A0A9W6RBC6_9PSEU|nr:hypothetical protein [Amycolatopsis taiwanensis]GLY71625.1 hypothetical protein Atai01_82440 [Amycolatopsis taiwanensis]
MATTPPPWRRLAIEALFHAMEKDQDAVDRSMTELIQTHGTETIPEAATLWADALIANWPDLRNKAHRGFTFYNEETGQDRDINDVHPAVVWAARFITARALNDDDQLEALFASPPSDRAYADCVEALLDTVATSLRNLTEGTTDS